MASIRSDKQFVNFFGSDSTQVANSGYTKEELQLTKGSPDKDVRLNPMPELGVVDSIFPNPRKTSDRQRIEEPVLGNLKNAEDQVRLTQFFIRSALKRQKGQLGKRLRQFLTQRRGQFGDRAQQMEASFERVDRMVDLLEFYSEMADNVLHRVISQQKG